LTSNGGKALAIQTDVTDVDQVQQLVDAAVQTYGRIDVMFSKHMQILEITLGLPETVRGAPNQRATTAMD
jgi:NAD(P)-dependent dehydrogenase (short-subunit alcohol dehydrogenase family)